MKYLICEISDDDVSSYILVIELTKEEVSVITARLIVAQLLKEKDGDALCIKYCAAAQMYDYKDDLVDLLPDVEQRLLSDQGWVLTDEKVFSDFDRFGNHGAFMHVRATGSVYWTVVPKHWDTALETRGINVRRDLIPHVE